MEIRPTHWYGRGAMTDNFDANDRACMTRAIAAAAQVRCITSPNPWVGAVVRSATGQLFEGATAEAGGDHAEVDALRRAGSAADSSSC